MSIDLSRLPYPCYLLEASKLRKNLELIDHVQQASGCNIIMAQKGFAMWSAFPMVMHYLPGCSASSYNEARLAREHFGGHIHLYALPTPRWNSTGCWNLLTVSPSIRWASGPASVNRQWQQGSPVA